MPATSPLYASSYGVYLLLIFVALFVTFLVLYLNERNKNQSANTSLTVATNPSTLATTTHAEPALSKLVAPAFTATHGFVTVKLEGGLGNQLFQLATAYAYGRDFNKTLIMDHTQTQVGSRKTYFDTVYSWATDSRDIKRKNWRHLSEAHFHFAALPDQFGNVELRGYFQSLQYFSAYKDELVSLFKQSTPAIPADHVTLHAIRASLNPTVSLHIRRSDYVGNSMHPVQPIEYYRDALALIQQRLKNPKSMTVIVFSDDIQWCQTHLPVALTQIDLIYVNSANLTDAQELVLMSECQHHVIANSSFSWWGAMYNQKPDTIVVAPKLWFGNAAYNWNDVYCSGWIVI